MHLHTGTQKHSDSPLSSAYRVSQLHKDFIFFLSDSLTRFTKQKIRQAVYLGTIILRSWVKVLEIRKKYTTLAWKSPWMEEPGGLQSMGSLKVGHD